MLPLGWLLCVGAVLLAAPAPASAQSPEALRDKLGSTDFTLAADEVRYDRQRDVYEASGSVRVEQSDGRVLTTDWLVFNGTTRIGVASGGVRMLDATDTMDAEFLAVDLRTMVALATHAELDSPEPSFAMRTEAFKRTGLDSYQVERAMFTTCRCPSDEGPRPWELDVQDAKVTLGGYAVGRNLYLKMLGVPVFYLPWIAFPVKTERQTGFLLPSLSLSGRSGAEVETPFFVAAGENVNLTLRPTWISKRGFKGGAELEYVSGEESWGEAGFAVLAGDDEVNRDDFKTPFSDDRWAYWARHEQPLGPNARFGLDARAISDNQYVTDFEDLPGRLRNARFLESNGWLTGSFGGLYAGIEAALSDDLQSPNDLDRDDFMLQRLPDVRLASLPRRFAGPLRFGFDSRYTYFHQRDGRSRIGTETAVNHQFFDTGRDALFNGQEPLPDGSLSLIDVHRDDFAAAGRDRSEGDGFYQEGELLADRGHRIDLYPHVTLPRRLGIFETLSEIGYRETLYLADAGDNERREIWTGRFDVRTRLTRSFSARGLPLRHVLEPRATFAAVSTPSQRLNPLFLPASSLRPQRLIDGDARLLTRNPTDRVEDERVLQVQLGNRFYGASREGGVSPTLFGDVRVGSGYDFVRGHATRVFATGSLWPREALAVSFDAGWDPDEERVDEASATLTWDAPRGHMLGISYRYLRERIESFENFVRQDDIFDEFDDEGRISQIGLNSVLVVSRRVQLFGSGFLALTQSSSSAGSVGLLLGSDCRCWDLFAELEHRTRPSETRLRFQLRLSGLGRRSRVYGRDVRGQR